MRICSIALLLVALVAAQGAIGLGQDPNQQSDLLREGKLALLDGRLEEALKVLRDLQQRFPAGDHYWESVFFEAHALQKMTRKEEALKRYRELVEKASRHPLYDQAYLSMVELSIALYEEGIPAYIARALEALESQQETIRQAAALRLSYVEDRELAEKAVPELRRLTGESNDAELRNQATVALLRIDPQLLMQPRAHTNSPKKGLLRMTMSENGSERISLNFPISFARLLLNAMPASALRDLEEEGIDAHRLLEELEKAEGVIEFETEGTRVRIWIE